MDRTKTKKTSANPSAFDAPPRFDLSKSFVSFRDILIAELPQRKTKEVRDSTS